MPNTLPENWFEVSPTRYEYRSGPYRTDHSGKAIEPTLYRTVVTVQRKKDFVEVSVDSFTGGYADGAAFASAEIPLEIIHRLISEAETACATKEREELACS